MKYFENWFIEKHFERNLNEKDQRVAIILLVLIDLLLDCHIDFKKFRFFFFLKSFFYPRSVSN